jgi:hypothetical protein
VEGWAEVYLRFFLASGTGAKHDFILCERHPMPFDAFYVSMLSEKYRKSAFPFIKGLITGSEAWIVSLAKKDRSSSMIYVFRKK